MTRFLLDTNVLVYGVDVADPVKQARAIDVIRWARGRGGMVSTQVVGEFVRAVTTRIAPPLRRCDAVGLAREYLLEWPVLTVEPITTVEALRGFAEHGLSWWDAQLWATARMSGVPVIVTEDFEDGRVIDGIRFTDPFAEGFEVASLEA
ncbi:MAG TPA: PIN domain-containing protein [Coriobacteriia bacterium]